MRPALLPLALLLILPAVGLCVEVLNCDFSAAPHSPWLRAMGDAQVTDGVMGSRAQANWRRSGLCIGPLPVKGVTWTIGYDVRPVAFGSQCQEFVSESPSTHWYMVYVRPDGKLAMHTFEGRVGRALVRQDLAPGTARRHLGTSIRYRSGEGRRRDL